MAITPNTPNSGDGIEQPGGGVGTEQLPSSKVRKDTNENVSSTFLSEEEMKARRPNKVLEKLKQLNPGIDIKFGELTQQFFYCSVDPEKLILPEDFYYTEKNGFIYYTGYHVLPMEEYEGNEVLPMTEEPE